MPHSYVYVPAVVKVQLTGRGVLLPEQPDGQLPESLCSVWPPAPILNVTCSPTLMLTLPGTQQ
jgi:hypothetical protein